MNGKLIALIVVIIIAVVGVSAFLLIQTPQDISNGNDTNKTNGTNNGTINNKTNVNVSAVLSGPSSSKEGSTITLTWKVTNNGNTDITNVQGSSQDEYYNFGTIGPGQTKTHTFNTYIPTTEGIKEDFGENATISNPFLIGGFGLSFSVNGQEHSIQSNSIEIPLN